MNEKLAARIQKRPQTVSVAHLGRHRAGDVPDDLSEPVAQTWRSVHAYTMTSPLRVDALVRGAEYVVANRIRGSIVECGVWRGGSMMAAALTLVRLGEVSRDLWLYDTFAGMTEPTAVEHAV